jgi:hypothetical protein
LTPRYQFSWEYTLEDLFNFITNAPDLFTIDICIMVVQRYCKTTSSCSHTKDDFHRLGDEVEENDKKLLKEKIRELKNMIGEFSPNTKEFKEEIERENLLGLLIDEDKPLSVKEIADLIGIREDVISEYQLDLYKTGY